MRETASGRRQAPRHVASILDSARELGIRDAQVYKRGPPGQANRKSRLRLTSRSRVPLHVARPRSVRRGSSRGPSSRT